MIRKQTISFILMLCLMQSALMHAFSPVDYAKSFYYAAEAYARKNTVVAASLLISVVGVVAALIYKKNKKVVNEKVISVNAPVEHVVTESESPVVEEVIVPEEAIALPENDVNPYSEEKKILVTIEMTPLYDQSSGSYDAYLLQA